jgi:DNA-binding NarL/FixJ family response regulator
MRSVLIVCDEYRFLLASYSRLRHDARVGRIEATANEAEALTLADSYHPDVVVFDAAPSGGFGLATVRRLCESNPGVDVVVTMGETCPADLAGSALASGAVRASSRRPPDSVAGFFESLDPLQHQRHGFRSGTDDSRIRVIDRRYQEEHEAD